MKELLIRFRLGMNTFWKRMLAAFLTLATVAATVVEVLPMVVHDEVVPDNWKTYLRIVYGFCLGISIAARLTVKDHNELQKVKSKDEFQEKLQP